jgi:hypothetical protein
MKTYKHEWKGSSYFQCRCAKCGREEFSGCDMMDVDGSVKFINRVIKLKDCPIRGENDKEEVEVTRFDLLDFED